MTERNRFIDIAKGMAIILVIFNHYEWQKSSIFQTHLYYWLITIAVPIFMLCTGYVTAVSFDSKNISLEEATKKSSILPKLKRYTMPFLWFYIAETLFTFISIKTGFLDYIGALDFPYNAGYRNMEMTLPGTLIFFIAGGRGQHGTYYYPVIMQVVFLIPFIYNTVKKSKYGIWKCFAVAVGLDIIFAIISTLSGVYVSGFYNRMIAVRYIFALSLGCHIYLYRKNLGKYKWYIMFILGVAYTILISYTGYKPFVYKTWKYTSALNMFYIAPIFMLGTKYLKNIKFRPLEEIGKASYHILMVQILFFNFLAPLIWTAPKSIIPNDSVGFILSLVVCLGGGYGYYLLYNFSAKRIKKKKSEP